MRTLFCWIALLGWLGACGAAQWPEAQSTAAARNEVWAAYGGKDGAACTGKGASQAHPPMYVLNVDVSASAAQATFRGEPRRLDHLTADRLQTALQANGQRLLSCVRDLHSPAKLEGELEAGPKLTMLSYYGLEPAEVECLRTALDGALAGVDYGQTQVLRLQLGRTTAEPADSATAPADPDKPALLHGSLSKAAIQEVIANHIAEVRTCYTSALIGWPNIAGRVEVKFIIGPDGAVQKTAVATTTLEHRAVECCITSTLRDWQFPHPMGGGIVVVTYPFVLQQAP